MDFLLEPLNNLSWLEQVSPLFLEQRQKIINQVIVLVLEKICLTIAPRDAMEPWKLGSEDAKAPIMQGINGFHRDIFSVLILCFCYHRCWLALYCIFSSKLNQSPKGLFMGLLSRLFGPYFKESSRFSSLYHICYFILHWQSNSRCSHYNKSYWTSVVWVCLFMTVFKCNETMVHEANGLPVISHSRRQGTIRTIAC